MSSLLPSLKVMLQYFFIIIILYAIFTHVYFLIYSTHCNVSFFLSNDRRKDKNKLRIVQYNVEWLFIDYNSDANCPGKGCTWVNENEAKKHITFVAKIINDLDPDLIVLCEIQGCNELNILKNHLDGTYSSYLKKGSRENDQNVALLSRIDPVVNLYRNEERIEYPIADSKCGYNGPTKETNVSKHYITEFNFDDMQVALIAAHLLAFPNDFERCAEREAQALILQQTIVSYIDKGFEIILLGDFNDYDSKILDVNKNKPNSQVLEILKGSKGEFAGKYQLYSVAENIDPSKRYTGYRDSDRNSNTIDGKDFALIDYILVTDAIKNKILHTFIYHGYQKHFCKYFSDHFPVVIDLQV